MPVKKVAQVNTTLSAKPLVTYRRLLSAAIASMSVPQRDSSLHALRMKDWPALLGMAEPPMPQEYASASSYFEAAQFSAFIRKYPFTPHEIPGIDPEAVALEKFRASELSCEQMNTRIRESRSKWDDHAQLWAWAREYIRRVLGDSPDLSKIYSLGDFTSGATMGVNGSKTNLARKIFANTWTVSPRAYRHALSALWANPHVRDCILPGAIKCVDPVEFVSRVKGKIEPVNYNNVSFVPKTAKSHRTIAVEPTLNGYVLKGIDLYMRQKLLHTGIDLSDQVLNQTLARLGTVQECNPYCTIDLSSASDSISIELVREMLPPAWFELLDDVRVTHYKLPDGSIHRYEKFCSMGNGFCFPLQTLLYASLCHAAMRFCGDYDDFSVYGDDIIVPQSNALLVMELLAHWGFTTNKDKTFICGPFRESCGADWFEGQDVRPVHLDKELVDIRQLFSLHNSCLRSEPVEEITTAFRSAIRSVAEVWKQYLQPGRESGDTAFSVPLDIAVSSPLVKWMRKEQRWSWSEVLSSPVPDTFRLSANEYANTLMLAVLRGSDSRNAFCLRYETTARVRRVFRWFSTEYNEHIVEHIMAAKPRYLNSVRSVRKHLNYDFCG